MLTAHYICITQLRTAHRKTLRLLPAIRNDIKSIANPINHNSPQDRQKEVGALSHYQSLFDLFEPITYYIHRQDT